MGHLQLWCHLLHHPVDCLPTCPTCAHPPKRTPAVPHASPARTLSGRPSPFLVASASPAAPPPILLGSGAMTGEHLLGALCLDRNPDERWLAEELRPCHAPAAHSWV